MVSKTQKWGNSLAIRIPKAFADEMKLAENTSVRMMLKDGELVIAAIEDSVWKLDDLLAAVTDGNRHAGWETGDPAGKEIL